MAMGGKRNLQLALFFLKKGIMKAGPKSKAEIDPTRIALLIGINIVLGIVVHEGFFVVAGAIALGVLAGAAINAVQHHAEHARRSSHTK